MIKHFVAIENYVYCQMRYFILNGKSKTSYNSLKESGSNSLREHEKLFFIVTFFLLIFSLCAHANDKDNPLKYLKSYSNYQSVNASYVFGGQFYNDNFLYNPGYSVRFSSGKKIHNDVSLGLGSGLMVLTNENFIPLYIEIIGNKKSKDNTPFICFQGGYSIGWNSNTKANENYDFKGGAFINSGIGRKIKINDAYALLFHWSYCHQFAKIDYSVFGGQSISETVNYDMIKLSLGILFN